MAGNEQELKLVVTGQDKSGSQTLRDVAQQAEQVNSGLATVGATGESAMSALAIGAGAALGVLGVLATVIGGIIKFTLDAIDAQQKWGEQVDGIQRLTGYTAEYASTLGTIAEIAGVTTQEIETAAANQARIFYQATIVMQKMAEDAAIARQRAEERTAAFIEQNERRITEIRADGADKLQELAEREAEQREDYNRREAEAARENGERRAEIARATAERLSDLESQHVERVEQLQQRIVDASAQRAETVERNEARHTQRLADLTESLDETKAEYARKDADRVDEFNRRQLEATRELSERQLELARRRDEQIADAQERAAQRSEDLARRYQDAIASAEQSIEDLREGYAQRQEERQARLTERIQSVEDAGAQKRISIQDRVNRASSEFEAKAISAELAAFDAQQAEKIAGLQRAAAEEEQKAEAEFNKRISRLQARIDKENAEYARQTAAIKAELDQREKDLTDSTKRQTDALIAEGARKSQAEAEQLARDRAAAAEANDARLADIQNRIGRETVEYQRQSADMAKEYDRRAGDLDASLAKESEAYAIQTSKINEEAARRTEQLNAQYQRDRENAQLSFDAQVASNADAQAKILKDVQDRVDKANQAYLDSVKVVGDELGRQLAQIEQQAPPAARAVAALGLNFDEIKKLEPEKQMDLLLRKFADMPDGIGKSGVAMAIFGSNAKDVSKLAEVYTSQTLPEWIAKTGELNRLMSQDGVDAAVKFSEKQRELRLSLESVKLEVGDELLPKMLELEQALIRLWQKVGPGVIDVVGKIATAIGDIVDAVTRLLDLIDKRGSLGDALGFTRPAGGIGIAGVSLANPMLAGAPGAGIAVGTTIGEGIAGGLPAGQIINNTWNLGVQYAQHEARRLDDIIRYYNALWGGNR